MNVLWLFMLPLAMLLVLTLRTPTRAFLYLLNKLQISYLFFYSFHPSFFYLVLSFSDFSFSFSSPELWILFDNVVHMGFEPSSEFLQMYLATGGLSGNHTLHNQ